MNENTYIHIYSYMYKYGKNSTFLFVLEFLEKILKCNLSDCVCKCGVIHIIVFPTRPSCIVH